MRVASLGVRDVDTPIDAQDFARQAGVRVHEMRRVLQEQDPDDAGPTDGFQHGLEMRTNQPLPVLERQETRPGVENLYGIRSGAPLSDEIVRHRVRELRKQRVKRLGLAGGKRAQRWEILDATALD